jgi:hypothetical protein
VNTQYIIKQNRMLSAHQVGPSHVQGEKDIRTNPASLTRGKTLSYEVSGGQTYPLADAELEEEPWGEGQKARGEYGHHTEALPAQSEDRNIDSRKKYFIVPYQLMTGKRPPKTCLIFIRIVTR